MGRKIFALPIVACAGLMAGAAVMVLQPHLFLPVCFGWFHCYTNAALIGGAIEGAASIFILVLAPTAVVFLIWRWVICLKEHGMASLTHDQSVALLRNHLSLRVLLNTTTLLALIAGGLLVQIGFMNETPVAL